MQKNQLEEQNTQPRIEKQNTQLKALLFKNAQLQVKQPCTNCCQIMTPVICLIFTFLIKELATQQLPKGDIFADNTYPFVFGDSNLTDSISLQVDKNSGKRYQDIPSRNNPLQWYLYSCEDRCNESSNLLGQYDGMSAQVNPSGQTVLGSVANDKSQFFVPDVQIDYYKDSTPKFNRYVPFFVHSDSLNKDLFDRGQKIAEMPYQTYKSKREGLDTVPDGAVVFHDVTSNMLNVSFKINTLRDLSFHRNNGVTNFRETRKIKDAPIWQAGTNDIITPYGFLKLQHLITSAYAYVVGMQAGKPVSIQSGYIFTRATDDSKSFVDSIINTTSALLFPLALSLLFPVMLYGLVLQKEEKLVQMMKMNGMKISSYWLVYFIFNFTLCLITNIVFFMLGAFVLKTDFFLKTSPLLLFLVPIGWSFSMIGMAAFFQTFLSKSRSANIIGYIVAIWTMMIGSTLSVGVYQVPSQFPGWLQALPPFAFNRLFYLMLNECSDFNCYQSIGQITGQMQNEIIDLYVGGLVFFLLGAYLLQVLPQQFGVSRHPLFPFKQFYKFIMCKEERSYSKPDKDRELKRYLLNDEQDPLSKAQRQNISKMREIDDSPLIINNLRKLYKKQGYVGDYPAVKSFNLKVHQRQTFGLLGPNGAGKTTLISMLTGMVTPNYGNAWIGGYDINSNISKAQLQMGVCPQFDLLWPQLTVQEHLRFYGRLKGIPADKLENKIEQAISQVNLTPFKNFLSSSLSGGMKRRLSIAISLVGDPQLVFLDEPSTGLDPDNRRQIWQVLVKCQQKRSLFLTTHIMQQADALCHRIGIITHGTLRTIGNQIKLKKQYGEGYRLSLSLLTQEKRLVSPTALNMLQNVNLENHEQENEEGMRRSIHELVEKQSSQSSDRMRKGTKHIEQFISGKFPGSTLARKIGSSLVFKIPAEFKISQMFIDMHRVENELGITNVSITQSSLEDVFIAVVLKYDKIVDDQQAGGPRLVQIEGGSIASDQSNSQSLKEIIPTPPPLKKEDKSSNQRYGSILEKNRESVFSEEQIRRGNRADDDG